MHPDTLKFYKYAPIKKPVYSGKFCYTPFNSIQIDNDGDVQLCDCQLHMPYTIGNIFKDSLSDIWTNQEAELVRTSVVNGDFTYCNWACSSLAHLPSAPAETPKIRNFPKTIKLDLDLSCNLKCPSCRETVIIEKNSEKIKKQIEVFEEIKQWALAHPDQAVTVIPLGSGEIFASHSGLKFLESLVDYPHQNLKIHIATNGTLITKNKELISSINNHINYWAISIDAASAETYQQVRGADWQTLQHGLEYINSLGSSMKFNFVVQKNNWHEILEFAELAAKYAASANYTNLLDWGHWTIKWWHDNNVLDRTKQTYYQVLESLRVVKNKYPNSTFSSAIKANLKKTEHN